MPIPVSDTCITRRRPVPLDGPARDVLDDVHCRIRLIHRRDDDAARAHSTSVIPSGHATPFMAVLPGSPGRTPAGR